MLKILLLLWPLRLLCQTQLENKLDNNHWRANFMGGFFQICSYRNAGPLLRLEICCEGIISKRSREWKRAESEIKHISYFQPRSLSSFSFRTHTHAPQSNLFIVPHKCCLIQISPKKQEGLSCSLMRRSRYRRQQNVELRERGRRTQVHAATFLLMPCARHSISTPR